MKDEMLKLVSGLLATMPQDIADSNWSIESTVTAHRGPLQPRPLLS